MLRVYCRISVHLLDSHGLLLRTLLDVSLPSVCSILRSGPSGTLQRSDFHTAVRGEKSLWWEEGSSNTGSRNSISPAARLESSSLPLTQYWRELEGPLLRMTHTDSGKMSSGVFTSRPRPSSPENKILPNTSHESLHQFACLTLLEHILLGEKTVARSGNWHKASVDLRREEEKTELSASTTAFIGLKYWGWSWQSRDEGVSEMGFRRC